MTGAVPEAGAIVHGEMGFSGLPRVSYHHSLGGGLSLGGFASFDFGGYRPVDAFDASIDATFADDQDDVAENELPTEGYTMLDASLSYTFAEPGLYVFLRGSNLLDATMLEPAVRRLRPAVYIHSG